MWTGMSWQALQLFHRLWDGVVGDWNADESHRFPRRNPNFHGVRTKTGLHLGSTHPDADSTKALGLEQCCDPASIHPCQSYSSESFLQEWGFLTRKINSQGGRRWQRALGQLGWHREEEWGLESAVHARHGTEPGAARLKQAREVICYIPSQKSPGWKRILELCRHSKGSGCFKYKFTLWKNNIPPPKHQGKGKSILVNSHCVLSLSLCTDEGRRDGLGRP